MLRRICLIINPRIVVERAMLMVVSSKVAESKEKPDFKDRENRANKEKRKPR
jgi:hypothetical protein